MKTLLVVILSQNLNRFLNQLSPELRTGIRSSSSQTVFRFGNNGTLPSLFSVYVPLRMGGWFRIEVVEGKTPFLLSNIFLRKIKGQLDFEQDVLRIPRWQHEVQLVVDNKGLCLIDMVELLGALKGREREGREKSTVKLDTSWTLAASAPDLDVPDLNQKTQSVSQASDSHGEFPRPTSHSSGRCRDRLDVQQRGGQSTDRHSHSSRMGGARSRLGEAQGSEVPSHLRDGSGVRQVYTKQAAHQSINPELPELLHRQERQGNTMGPGSVPLRSSTTSGATVLTEISQTEMTAGRMKSPSQHDQRPIPPGKPVTPRVTDGSSSSKRESSWAVLKETRKPMTTELTPSREQEIRTQMALLQRELDQASGSS